MSCWLQVGSADHRIHYFDLRNPSKSLFVFRGHRKAVSYVKFLSPNELASASTDSTIRLWDVQTDSSVSDHFPQLFPICHNCGHSYQVGCYQVGLFFVSKKSEDDFHAPQFLGFYLFCRYEHSGGTPMIRIS